MACESFERQLSSLQPRMLYVVQPKWHSKIANGAISIVFMMPFGIHLSAI